MARGLPNCCRLFSAPGYSPPTGVLREQLQWMGDARWQSLRRYTHLPARVSGYALALFAWARNERPDWSQYLRPDAAAVFSDGLRYLERSDDSLFRPDAAAQQRERPPIIELVSQLESGTPAYRMAALWWLAEIGKLAGSAAAPAVLQAMQDADWELRREAVQTLASLAIDGDQAHEALLRSLRDHRREVRSAAAGAAGELRYDSAEILSELAFLLEDSDSQVAMAAAWGLEQYGQQAASMLRYLLAALRRGLVECDEPLADATAAALRSTAAEGAEYLLSEFFAGDDDLHVRAIHTLRKSGSAGNGRLD